MISYIEVYAIFCTRMDFRNIFVMSLDCVEIKLSKQDTLSPSTAIFLFISDETIYQNKSDV